VDQKNYLVVGGSSGIGLSVVQRLVDRGNHVRVLSRSCDRLAAMPNVEHLRFDVLDDEIDSSMIPPQVHGLAYCVGSINLGPVRRLTAESLIKDFRLNLVGAVAVLQASLSAMKAAESSSMLMFSTVAVGQGMPMHASVAAAKGAVEGLTRSLAAELSPAIRVNCIAPSLTDTPLSQSLLSNDKKREAMALRHPLNRVGEPDDIAALAEFLLTENSKWITGQVIGVDGGLSTIRK
jgi:NAD(P)-dependent dehydrogenase (short-subunit alcohol dehydrogenase family)